MWEQDRLQIQSSLGRGLWAQIHTSGSGVPAFSRIQYRTITEDEYRRLKSIEENQVDVQEYENTITELEEILALKTVTFLDNIDNLEMALQRSETTNDFLQAKNDEYRLLLNLGVE